MTVSLVQTREKTYVDPYYLVEIETLNSGPTLYFSDRNITVAGQRYENYLSELSGVGEELKRATSQGLNANIDLKFKNDPFSSYAKLIIIDDTYPLQGAAVTIKEVSLVEGEQSAVDTIFTGILEEPRNIDLLNFETTVSSKDFIERHRNRRV